MAKNSFLIIFAMVLVFSIYSHTVFGEEDKDMMDKASDAAGKAKDAMGDAAGKTKDAAENMGNKASEAAKGAKDKASDATKDVKVKATETAKDAKDTGGSWADWIKGKFSEIGGGSDDDDHKDHKDSHH